jgi:hypothetical protein
MIGFYIPNSVAASKIVDWTIEFYESEISDPVLVGTGQEGNTIASNWRLYRMKQCQVP